MTPENPNAAVDGASDAFLEQWFERAPVGLAIVDARRRVLRTNDALGEIACGGVAALLEHPSVAAAVGRALAGEPVDALHVPRPGGDAGRLAVTLRPLHDAVAIVVEPIAREQLLDLTLERTATGTWVWDVDAGTITWSANLGPLHGMARGAAPNSYEAWLEAIHPDDRDAVDAIVDAAIAADDGFECEFRLAADDHTSTRWLHTRAHVVREAPDGPARAVIGVTTDVTERRRRTEAMEVLADAGLALAVMRTPEQTLQKITELAVPRLADWCAAHLLDADDRPSRVAVAHGDPVRLEWARNLKTGAGAGPVQVMRTGRSELHREVTPDLVETAAAGDPERAALIRRLGVHSAMVVPIVAHERTLGAITFLFTESDRRYDEADLALGEELGRRAGLAIANATLQLAQEEANRRLRDLQTVTDVALTHLELEAMLDELLRRLTAVLDSDIAKVLLYDDRYEVLRVRASIGLPEASVRELEVPAGAGVAGRIAVAGRPTILSDLGVEDVVLEDLREPGRAAAGVPLRIEGRTIGVLIVSTRERSYELADLELLELVADRAGLAIRQSELYEGARDAALSLQRSLLPDVPSVTAGLQVATRYLPGQDGDEVGGDWYDLFSLPDGRVAFVVGDIVGRGLHAAARMGRVRTALRAYAHDSPSPADAVERLDRLVAAEDIVEFATLVLVFLDPATGAARACSAGHPPPLLIDGDGARTLGVSAGPPIGVGTAARPETGLNVPVGATLVAYTDGLVERRTVALDAGIERLRAAAEAARRGGGAQRLVDGLVDALIGSGGTDDDVAIVAVRRLGTHLDRTFPAEPSAVAAARHEVTAFAEAHGLGHNVLGDLALAVSEACTNVVVHAYRDHPSPGPMHVTATVDDDGLEVTVADEGGGVRPRGDSPGVGLGLQIMARTADSCDVRDAPGGGARLVMRFTGAPRHPDPAIAPA